MHSVNVVWGFSSEMCVGVERLCVCILLPKEAVKEAANH